MMLKPGDIIAITFYKSRGVVEEGEAAMEESTEYHWQVREVDDAGLVKVLRVSAGKQGEEAIFNLHSPAILKVTIREK